MADKLFMMFPGKGPCAVWGELFRLSFVFHWKPAFINNVPIKLKEQNTSGDLSGNG